MEIVLLYGGDSNEREVSLRSGARVANALRERGHCVRALDVRGAPAAEDLAAMRAADAVFLALHGGAGEDGRLQALLERSGIRHYTGSPPRGAALAMHKERAKLRVCRAGVRVAKGRVVYGECSDPPLPYPFVCKPLRGGSSVGLSIVSNDADWQKLAPLGHFFEETLCESYLSGREYTVGVLAGRALPVVEIRPRGGVYDYHHKYTPDAVIELCPAPLPTSVSERLLQDALRAFCALGLRDYARIDFREDDRGIPHFLEANALPGMTETSLLPLAARANGMDLPTLCERMACLAANRKIR